MINFSVLRGHTFTGEISQSKLFPDISACKLFAAMKVEPYDIKILKSEIDHESSWLLS
jgi:hypothetical protein